MTRNVATWPNLVTLLRLLCLPLFLWLLFTRDDRAAAAYLLGVLGATDWIDGWLARRLQQRSEFGAVFDPAVDRLLFIVGVGAIIVDGSVPGWLGWGVVAREVFVGVMMLVGTALGMQRFPVSQWGKNYTFALMFAFPLLLLGASDAGWALGARNAGWAIAMPGAVLCYTTAIAYLPRVWRGVRAARSGEARGRSARDASGVA
ncbi:MAG: CDP-diacylglycerol--glycerol-3-phosphate 3-phosphatidyltransferase [Actinomycetota bacterium]|jgi:cardiolipin synthase